MTESPSRGEDAVVVPLPALPTQQRIVLTVIDQYVAATGEACPGRLLARRLRVHHSTIQQHLSALYRKGWLRAPNAPAFLRRALP